MKNDLITFLRYNLYKKQWAKNCYHIIRLWLGVNKLISIFRIFLYKLLLTCLAGYQDSSCPESVKNSISWY